MNTMQIIFLEKLTVKVLSRLDSPNVEWDIKARDQVMEMYKKKNEKHAARHIDWNDRAQRAINCLTVAPIIDPYEVIQNALNILEGRD